SEKVCPWGAAERASDSQAAKPLDSRARGGIRKAAITADGRKMKASSKKLPAFIFFVDKGFLRLSNPKENQDWCCRTSPR
ncbi:hypothetical protein, partial [Anaerotruncus sp. AF02-27]|uniref:hypothetical protein n=1 Tax=Anaerotruncus sp. AF02-27 TaxID=2292191 RepID=UPI0018F6761D